MNNLNQTIENHYHKENIYEEIIQRLEEQGADLKKIYRSDIAGVDEFHVRGAEVSGELALSIDLKGKKILDVGCGLGGPCRMLAEEFNCDTTGIDLSGEFIRTARKLSELVKLDKKTNFIQGDANDLPFENESFDVVWTQHVQMNIPDKTKFYSEIYRVLKKSGHFIYYEILKKGNGAIKYPTPWATNSEQSFLITADELNMILSDLNFKKLPFTDQTKKGIDFFETLLERMDRSGPPKIGLNILMGNAVKTKIVNLLTGLKKGYLELQSGVCIK